MRLSMSINHRLLGVLESTEDGIRIVESTETMRSTFLHLQTYGIKYPEGFPLAHHNTAPDQGPALLRSFKALYEQTLVGVLFELEE